MSCNKKNIRNLFHRIGGAMLLFLVLNIFLRSGAAELMESLVSMFPRSDAIYILCDLLCSLSYVVSFVLPVIFFYLISGKKAKNMALSLRLCENRTVLSTLTIVFLGVSACFACSYINSILFPVSEQAYDMINPTRLNDGYQLVLMFISMALVPAFSEELLFRGMLVSNICPYNESAAIVISAILFGLMHETPFQFFYATAMGIIFGIVYIKTGSIWSGILLHFFNNFFSVIQLYISQVFDERKSTLIYSTMMCVIIGCGILLGAIFYIASRVDRKTRATETLGMYGEEILCEKTNDHTSFSVVMKAALSPVLVTFCVLCVLSILFTAIAMWMV